MTGQELSESYDVVILGAGPAGSRLGYRLAKDGCRVLIADKAPFPRHRIGESLTGECGKMLAEMGLDPHLAAQRFPVKRGVRVCGPTAGSTFYVPVQDTDETGQIVARSTWQVRRPEFDQMMLDAARAEGADYLLAEARDVVRTGSRIEGVMFKTPQGEPVRVGSRVLVDASGYSTFLNRRGVTGPKRSGQYDKQIAVFAQLRGVKRNLAPASGDTVLFYAGAQTWAWSIPIDDDITSVGVVSPVAAFTETGLTPELFFETRMKTLHPALASSTQRAQIISDVWRRSNYSYRVEDFAGDGYVCIGDAHRFLDPIFSFGVYLGMKEADLAVEAIHAVLGSDSTVTEPFAAFMEASDRAQQIVQDIINTFWSFPLVFLKLAHYSHQDEMAELFAGRIFDREGQNLEIVGVMRNLLATKGL